MEIEEEKSPQRPPPRRNLGRGHGNARPGMAQRVNPPGGKMAESDADSEATSSGASVGNAAQGRGRGRGRGQSSRGRGRGRARGQSSSSGPNMPGQSSFGTSTTYPPSDAWDTAGQYGSGVAAANPPSDVPDGDDFMGEDSFASDQPHTAKGPNWQDDWEADDVTSSGASPMTKERVPAEYTRDREETLSKPSFTAVYVSNLPEALAEQEYADGYFQSTRTSGGDQSANVRLLGNGFALVEYRQEEGRGDLITQRHQIELLHGARSYKMMNCALLNTHAYGRTLVHKHKQVCVLYMHISHTCLHRQKNTL